MLDERRLRTELPVDGLGEPLHVYDALDSTNDLCRELAEAGQPGGTLVLADEQRHGRGRGARIWYTPAQSAVAMSMLLRPDQIGEGDHAAVNMLGAVAVVKALDTLGLESLIKWPNDVLVQGRKVASVLTEAAWQGQTLEYVVLGIGVNVRPNSLPPEEEPDFPASYLDLNVDEPIDREALIVEIVRGLRCGLELLAAHQLLPWVEKRLAYMNQEVRIDLEKGSVTGRIVGLDPNGMLHVQHKDGEVTLVGSKAHLRSVD